MVKHVDKVISQAKRFHATKVTISLTFVIAILIFVIILFFASHIERQKQAVQLDKENKDLKVTVGRIQDEFNTLKNTDQIKRNDSLESTIKNIENAYDMTVITYEKLVDIAPTDKKMPQFRKDFAMILKYLKERNYSSASATLAALEKEIDLAREAAIATTGGIDLSKIPVNNAPPGSGYSRQQVQALDTTFLVDLVAGNLSSTRVIVDTASDGDCGNDCPTLPLATYVSRNGAYAGINGSYFCPAEYPTCAGKTNSFDTLAMNVKKHYFNSDNNVYSTVPAVIFGGGWVRFVSQSSQWGRDTGVDGVLANQPLLVSGGNVVFGGDGDPKKGSRGNRSFVSNKGSTVYIGIVRNATVAEVAVVLKTLGMENALNLDSGGSTALWSGGYKAGPGRNIPNAILFVNK